MMQSTAVLLVTGNEYALQHRDDIPTIADPNTLSTWGGLVEDDDPTIPDAACREIKEELDLSVDPNDLLFLNAEEIDARSPKHVGQRMLMCYFALEVPAGTILKSAEGQGIVFRAVPVIDRRKLNPISERAIELYEARKTQR
jgi:8-oxo-dGTP pyrophosphatase MutT (NUDIX family)